MTPFEDEDARGDDDDMPMDGLAETIRFLAGPPKLVFVGPVSSPGEPVRDPLPLNEKVDVDRANGGGVPLPSEVGIGAFGRVSARWGCCSDCSGEWEREMEGD